MHRPIPSPFYQRGPRKGQPKICRECPEPIHPNPQKFRLCLRHYRQYRSKLQSEATNRRSLKRLLRGLAPATNAKHNPFAKLQKRPGQSGYFDHLSPDVKVIAQREFDRQHNKKPAQSGIELARMVARSIAYANCGGKRLFDARGHGKRVAQNYWRDAILNHPERLPKGFTLDMLQK